MSPAATAASVIARPKRPTAGLADGTSDVAVAWAPVPGRVRTLELAREPVVVALPPGHPLDGRASVPFAAVRDEAFLALPPDAGPLRAFWLAEAHREGPPRVGAEIRSVEETHEALLDGRGVVLLAAGNAGALVRDVQDLPPCALVLAWRHDDRRPAVRAYVDACREVVAARG
ncbi:LysR substrate-binding domain-containing protein [Actinomycetospora sp. C-140]